MQPGKTTMVKKEDGKFGQQIDALQSNVGIIPYKM
jgi:hypothetical protein